MSSVFDPCPPLLRSLSDFGESSGTPQLVTCSSSLPFSFETYEARIQINQVHFKTAATIYLFTYTSNGRNGKDLQRAHTATEDIPYKHIKQNDIWSLAEQMKPDITCEILNLYDKTALCLQYLSYIL